eukprot:1136647-Pelagomonas_calceolata.AAC.5
MAGLKVPHSLPVGGPQLLLLFPVGLLKSLQERVGLLLKLLLLIPLPPLHGFIYESDPQGGGMGTDGDAAEGIREGGGGGAQGEEAGFVEVKVLA